jgi:hypothetical protein
MCHMHAPTFNKWHKKKNKNKNKKVTLYILTHGAMRGYGLTSLVVCINDKFCDIRESDVTIRSEIWTTNIRSLQFQDIRERVTLWGLILWSLGCTLLWSIYGSVGESSHPVTKCNSRRLSFQVSKLELRCQTYRRPNKRFFVWQNPHVVIEFIWVIT